MARRKITRDDLRRVMEIAAKLVKRGWSRASALRFAWRIVKRSKRKH